MMLACVASMLMMSAGGVEPSRFDPSFDCAKASNDVERTICKDPKLAKADREMAAAYAALATKLSGAAKENLEKEQVRWLEDDLLTHQKSEYRFVIAHHPPFTAVARRQGDNPHMTALVPMFEKYQVSAAFFGHDHNYQHYLKNGVHYVTTGGGRCAPVRCG